MNLLDIRDRIRDKAIDAGLTYTEIETLADTNELVNQTMPCLAWQYTGERGTIAEPNNELSLQVYLMTNYYDEIKVESEAYQRDWIITQQNELRNYFIDWIKELNFESGVTYLEVISYEEIPFAEKLTINGLLSIEFRVNIQIDRGFCLDTESVEYLNQVKVYFNNILRYTQAANVDLLLTLKDQDGNNINATFTGNNIVVNVGGGECEDANYTLKNTLNETIIDGSIGSGLSEEITAPDANYIVKFNDDEPIEYGVIASNETKTIIVTKPTCLDANYNLKDTLGNTLSSGTIASGATSNIVAPNADYILKDTSGTTLLSGSIESDGSEDIVAPDASYLVEYANGTDIQSGNIKSGSSLTITFPNPPTMQGAMPLKTGQTTSYQTGDDAFLQEGRLTNFTTLDFNNVFGNTTRFTDELGGQTYTNKIVIDHASKACDSNEHLAFYIGDATTTRTNSQAVTWGLGVSVGIYTSGWFLSNINQLLFICNFGVATGWMNYAPFFQNLGLWSSSRYSTGAIILIPQTQNVTTQPIGNSYRTFACRIMTWNGTSFI